MGLSQLYVDSIFPLDKTKKIAILFIANQKEAGMKGFTLIELLVVVLIIGILSAVALPQYEIVVEKSRATEALVNAKAIQDACQRHRQEYPEEACTTFDMLADVQLQGGSLNGSAEFDARYFTYRLSGDTLENNQIIVTRLGNLYTVTYPAVPGGIPETDCPEEYEQVCRLFTNL